MKSLTLSEALKMSEDKKKSLIDEVVAEFEKDDRSAAQRLLDVGECVYLTTERFAPDVVRQSPNGDLHLVTTDGDQENVIRELADDEYEALQDEYDVAASQEGVADLVLPAELAIRLIEADDLRAVLEDILL